MSDNYAALNNIFQAKATLQSIINNYNGDQELLDEANTKYNALLLKELDNTKIDMNDKNSGELEFAK